MKVRGIHVFLSLVAGGAALRVAHDTDSELLYLLVGIAVFLGMAKVVALWLSGHIGRGVS